MYRYRLLTKGHKRTFLKINDINANMKCFRWLPNIFEYLVDDYPFLSDNSWGVTAHVVTPPQFPNESVNQECGSRWFEGCTVFLSEFSVLKSVTEVAHKGSLLTMGHSSSL